MRLGIHGMKIYVSQTRVCSSVVGEQNRAKTRNNRKSTTSYCIGKSRFRRSAGMIDPQPLSDDISRHEVRSAFGRVKQDLAAINSIFTGLSDSAAFTPGTAGSNLVLTLTQEHTRLPDAGAAFGKQKELLAKIKEVNEDAARSRAIFEQRMQSIAKGRPR